MDEDIDEPDLDEPMPLAVRHSGPPAGPGIGDIMAADPFQSLENLTNSLLSSGLGEKYLAMVKHAQPIGPNGEWRLEDITVLLKIGEVVSRFLTKLNRAGSRRRRAVTESVDDVKKKIESLQAQVRAKEEQTAAARQAWRSGGVNRRGA